MTDKCVETSVETSGELETVGYTTAHGENYATGCYLVQGVKLYGMEALVTRSQAVELLAAKRAEKEELDAECRVLAKRCIEKDARIKELEKLCNDTEAEALGYASDKAELEAKLAAAEKALKASRPYVEDYDTRRHNTGVDETLTQIDAVLGGK